VREKNLVVVPVNIGIFTAEGQTLERVGPAEGQKWQKLGWVFPTLCL